MNLLFVLSRTVHIFASVLWVGGAIAWTFYFSPSIKASGPAGAGVLQNLIGRLRYPIYMSVVSLLTILSGAYLILVDSGGLQLSWFRTGPGIGFTLGAVLGIAVFFVGMLGIKPRGERMGALGREIAGSGGPPDPAQLAEMAKLEREIGVYERIDFVMLVVALLAMSTARFWIF
jgi:uncharacterized membrane protein